MLSTAVESRSPLRERSSPVTSWLATSWHSIQSLEFVVGRLNDRYVVPGGCPHGCASLLIRPGTATLAVRSDCSTDGCACDDASARSAAYLRSDYRASYRA